MFRVFISYSSEDKRKLADLLKWLEPLRQKYFLHIWYNRYTKYDTPNQAARPMELHSANLYIFLTTYHSVANSTIQSEEVQAAIARHSALGDDFVRIRPVLLSPSHWKNNSRLLLFEKNALPPKKELSKYVPQEEGFIEIMGALQKDIEAIRSNLIEDAKFKGLPTDSFFKNHALPMAKAPSKMQWRLQKLQEMMWVCLLLFLIWSLYTIGCENTMYPSNKYVPPAKNDQMYELGD